VIDPRTMQHLGLSWLLTAISIGFVLRARAASSLSIDAARSTVWPTVFLCNIAE
jgi:hypothetical protein